jgi:hypothetical protein
MRKIALYTATVLSIALKPAFAQVSIAPSRTKIPYFHAEGYVGGNTGLVFGLAAKLYFSNTLILGVDYNSSNFDAVKLPGDYEPGFAILSDGIPEDNIKSYSVLFGLYLPAGNSVARVALEAGPGFKTYTETNFIPHPPSNSWIGFSSNYDTYYKRYNTVGLSAEARVEFNISRFVGLGLGAILDVNDYKVLPGIKYSLLVGKLRDRVRYKR